jgi:hypothetical protein
MMEGSVQVMTDPDPGGPKTYESGSTKKVGLGDSDNTDRKLF